ncbi:hypothetical protein [Ferruginibacter sp.]|jgi:hypothetical protein
MKKLSLAFDLSLICLLFGSCSAIEGIFKAGFWSGIILVAVIIIAIIVGVTTIFKKKQ